MATVTFDHVTKKYGDVTAVDDLNLEIQDGEFMVLVGPSGCGKTTSLRMIAGLEEITAGTLRIGDRVVNDVAPKDRDIAMVFQSYALYPHMTVYDNLAFGLKLRKVPKADIDKRVQEAAGILDLGKLLARKPKELSGGQRQRVALGRAIVREPAVFLMDEPLSNLDAKLRVQTRAEIARLHQRLKTTIVYVTHDQVEAMTMGTRIAVMSDGLLQQVGTPAGALRHPGQPVRGRLHRQPGDELRRRGAERARATGRRSTAPTSSLPLPARMRESVGPTVGRKLVAGIRPEHLDLGTSGPDDATVQVKADVVEYLGNEELLHVTAGAKELVAVVGAEHRVRPGDILNLVVPLYKLHLFDAESGSLLAASTRPRRADRRPDRPTRGATIDPFDDPVAEAELRETTVDSRVIHRGPDADVPGRHHRADRRLAPPARDRRPSRGGRDRRARRRRPGPARSPVPDGRRPDPARDPGRRPSTSTRRPGRSRTRTWPRPASSRRRPASAPARGSKLGEFWTAPGFSDGASSTSTWRPTSGRPTTDRLDPDDDEALVLVRVPFDEAVAAAEDGRIADAKSIVGLLRLARLRTDRRIGGEPA